MPFAFPIVNGGFVWRFCVGALGAWRPKPVVFGPGRAVTHWPVLYALGGDDLLQDMCDRAWEGHIF